MNISRCLLLSGVFCVLGFCPLHAAKRPPEPTISNGNAYAQLSSATTQVPSGSALVTLENQDAIKNLAVQNDNKVVIQEAGNYFISVQGQVADTAFLRPGSVNLWLIRNNMIVPNTGADQSIAQWHSSASIGIHTILSLKHGDTISVGFAATTSGIGLKASPATATTPIVPSAIVTIFKL